MNHFALMLDHLIMLARNPGFKEHAWHRAKELDSTDLYGGMKAALAQRMKN